MNRVFSSVLSALQLFSDCIEAAAAVRAHHTPAEDTLRRLGINAGEFRKVMAHA